jgi:phosphotransferase system enzyme I (PtsP)
VLTESHKLILLEDISRIVASSHDLHETLDHITAILAERLGVEVCSIYLLEGDRLVLRSTRGLSTSAVGEVRMEPSEGLTGLTYETVQPVNVERAETHPRFKFFPGIGEESFRSYLGVPLIYRKVPIGVLAVQTVAPRAYSPDEVRLLVTAASQLSPVIAHARLLDLHGKRQEEPRPPAAPRGTFVRGIAVSPGVTHGVSYPLGEDLGLDAHPDNDKGPPEVELKRFEGALEQSIEEVVILREHVTRSLSEEDGAIFHAHLLMLEDRGLQEKVKAHIRAGAGAPQAISMVARGYIDAFLALEDPYLRERAIDARDVAQRLLGHLQEAGAAEHAPKFREPTVVIAPDLTPSEFVRLYQPNLVGVAVGRGGANSHTAILCRSAGIPAVVGLGLDIPRVAPGELVILDGNTGILYVSPSERVTREYARLEEDSRLLSEEFRAHVNEPAVTRDGKTIRLLGNAALVSDIPKILEAGGEGIGLYRTEFPFLIRTSFPDEEEQVSIYAKILDALGDRTATLRTLDVGGDKTLPYLPIPKEENPHLGWRSIRVSLEFDEPFRIQIRALLRASLLGRVRIVLPMISTVEEMRRAREIVDEERRALAGRGIEIPAVPLGAMIEVPSAALALDRIAPWADFFSIGTNDLVQYLLAVDRANRRVAHLYDPLHPTVVDLIAQIVSAARRLNRPIGVCGEMASWVHGAAALLAVGIEELSVGPGALPKIRRLIQTIDLQRLKALAPRLRTAEVAEEVRMLIGGELRDQDLPEQLTSAR